MMILINLILVNFLLSSSLLLLLMMLLLHFMPPVGIKHYYVGASRVRLS